LKAQISRNLKNYISQINKQNTIALRIDKLKAAAWIALYTTIRLGFKLNSLNKDQIKSQN
jgi:hypothetical protein